MIGVVAHQRGKVERRGKSSLAVRQKIAEALIGVFGRAESRKLAHGPKPRAIHRGMDAARVGRFAGKTEIAGGIPTAEIGIGVKPPDRITRSSCEFFSAFGIFRERGSQRVSLPRLLRRRGLA